MFYKGNIYIASLLLMYTFLLTACADEMEQKSMGHAVNLRLTVNLPLNTSSESSLTDDPLLDPETSFQRQINDIYVLQFNAGTQQLEHVVSPLAGKVSNSSLVLSGELKFSKEEVKLVVLANLNAQEGRLKDLSAETLMERYGGKTETEILQTLIFEVPQATPWQLSEQSGRPLPMWGEIPAFLMQHQNEKECKLYRAVAKMGVEVAPECDNFRLQEVYLFHASNQGYCAPVNQVPQEDVHVQFSQPDIPDGTERFDVEHPVVYRLGPDEVRENRLVNQIYVAEADNYDVEDNELPLKLVVGGYRGHDTSSLEYYCIDMAERDANGKLVPFNIIRNHSYVFTIRKVLHPGEHQPEKALPHLLIEVADYTAVYMRGVPDQYTLRTDQSLVRLKDNKDLSPHHIMTFTDLGEGWTIEQKDDWFTVSPHEGKGNQEYALSIQANKENRGTTREGSFYIVAGNIKKEIKVMMPQAETANSYIVGEGEHELVVTIKGNGKEGVFAEGGISLIPGKPHPSQKEIEDFVNLNPAYVKVLWETYPNLVQLIGPDNTKIPNGPEIYKGMRMDRAMGRASQLRLEEDQTTVKYNVGINSTGASIGGVEGGNAVIGAFDENDHLLWSWHIWVVPNMLDRNQKVKEECVEHWQVNDYDVMDRNLGALTNRPIDTDSYSSSIASMGLLYQWGRKDPFIGANYSSGKTDGNVSLINDGLIRVHHYYEYWGTMKDDLKRHPGASVMKTIHHPTQLIYQPGEKRGLSTIDSIGQYLWGVADGLNPLTMNLGIKTIYDPSPAGFRIPPVDAFVFKSLSDEPRWTAGEEVGHPFLVKQNSSIRNSYSYAVIYGYRTESNENISGLLEPGEEIVYNGADLYVYVHLYKARRTREILSSATTNWAFNLIFVPHYVDFMRKERYQWGNEINNNPYHPENLTPFGSIYMGNYIEDARYYGFYLNHIKAWSEPALAPVTRLGSIAGKNRKDSYYYRLKANQEDSCSWFPLTAVYNPEDGITLNRITIQRGFSVNVNSFLWTNTTVTKSGKVLPAAMFLHGTENNGDERKGNGRHIHRLLDDKIEAEPQYAGAVRCIRDRKKTVWDVNSLTETTNIVRKRGARTTITIVSVNSDWKLVRPGAPWIKATPDSGHADNGKGQSITLSIVGNSADLPPAGTITSLEFKIADGLFNRTVTVTLVDQ